jgi:hypothetical protein
VPYEEKLAYLLFPLSSSVAIIRNADAPYRREVGRVLSHLAFLCTSETGFENIRNYLSVTNRADCD